MTLRTTLQRILISLAIGLPGIPATALAQDTDGDGVLDTADNCRTFANAGASACDTDADGYGNACDGDFNQDGVTDAMDFVDYFLPDFGSGVDSGIGTDMDCDGAVTGIDFGTHFIANFSAGTPGPASSSSQSVELGDVVIDEVMFAVDPEGGEFADAPWVELFNRSEATVDLTGWRIATVAGEQVTLPSADLAPGARVVAVFGDGVNDPEGVLYFGANTLTPVEEEDGIALYAGPDPSDIVDFVAWSRGEIPCAFPPNLDLETLALEEIESGEFPSCNVPAPTPAEGPALDDAVSAGLWIRDERIATSKFSDSARGVAVGPGESISRNADSEDTDSADDFRLAGARLGAARTPRYKAMGRLPILIDSGPPAAHQKAKWTLMMYLTGAGDPTLDAGLFYDLDQISSVPRGTEVHVVAQIDGGKTLQEWRPGGVGYVPVAGTEGGTWRGEVLPDKEPGRVFLRALPPFADQSTVSIGDARMGEGDTLRTFVEWSMRHYPADKYALVIGGHGLGWKGVALDVSNSGSEDSIQIGELGNALNGIELDMIGFHACLMGQIEVAWEMRHVAKGMVASETIAWDRQWQYNKLITDMQQHPEWSGDRLAEQVATRMIAASKKNENYGGYWTGAAYALDHRLETLSNAVEGLAIALGASATTRNPDEVGGIDDHGENYGITGTIFDNVQFRLGANLRQTQHMGRGVHCCADYVDLRHLALRLSEDTILPQSIRTAAGSVLTAHAAAVPVANHGTVIDKRTGGMAIYFPSAQSNYPHPSQKHHNKSAAMEAPLDMPQLPYASGGAWARTPDNTAAVKYAPDLNPAFCGGERPDHARPNAPDFDFATHFYWGEMLHRFHEPVADADCKPKVFFGGGATVCSSAGSDDWDGMVVGWSWDRDDGVNSDNRDVDFDCSDEANDDLDAGGATTTFRYASRGAVEKYGITLTVEDDHGMWHTGHHETDQDRTEIVVLPFTHFIPDPSGTGGDGSGTNPVDTAAAWAEIGVTPWVARVQAGEQIIEQLTITEVWDAGELSLVGAFDLTGTSFEQEGLPQWFWDALQGIEEAPEVTTRWLDAELRPGSIPGTQEAVVGPLPTLQAGEVGHYIFIFDVHGDVNRDGGIANLAVATAAGIGEGISEAPIPATLLGQQISP